MSPKYIVIISSLNDKYDVVPFDGLSLTILWTFHNNLSEFETMITKIPRGKRIDERVPPRGTPTKKQHPPGDPKVQCIHPRGGAPGGIPPPGDWTTLVQSR